MMESKHVEVRIRNAEEAEANHVFTTWPLNELDVLLTLLAWWPTPADVTFSGQLSYDPEGRWYFEVVAEEPSK